MPNPLTDELSDEAKAELAAKFAELRRLYPPGRLEHIGGWTLWRTRPQPWRR